MTLEWMSFTVLHTYYLAIVYFRNVADKNNDKWLILVMLEGEESRHFKYVFREGLPSTPSLFKGSECSNKKIVSHIRIIINSSREDFTFSFALCCNNKIIV